MSITITPTKILYSSSGKRSVNISSDKLHLYIWEPLQIKRNVTLKRLISLTENTIDIWQLLLQENIKPFLPELQKSVDKATPIEWFEVFWEATLDNIDDEKDFDLIPVICGKRKSTNTELDPSEFGIGLTPLNNVGHLPVCLNTKVDVKIYTYKNNDIVVDTLNFGERDFTVIEFFKSLFMEVTFFETPEKRKEQLDLLLQNVCEIKKHFLGSTMVSQNEREEQQRKNTLNLLGDDDDSN